jgi:hypothetical protein
VSDCGVVLSGYDFGVLVYSPAADWAGLFKFCQTLCTFIACGLVCYSTVNKTSVLLVIEAEYAFVGW